MPLKRVVAQIGDTEIKVENTWLSGARLFVNGSAVARTDDYFALNKSKPMMTAKVVIDGAEKLVEVFCFALFTVKIKICVDGIQLAGDRF